MQNGQRGDQIDQPVQLQPAAPKPAAHASRTARRQRHEQRKGNETHGDERALQYIAPHLFQIKKMIEPQEAKEMQASIKECVQAQHTPKAEEYVETR